MRATVLIASMVLATFSTWVLLTVTTSTYFLVFWGLVRAVVSASCCSTSIYLVLDLCCLVVSHLYRCLFS